MSEQGTNKCLDLAERRNLWKSMSFGTWTVGKQVILWYIINNY